MTMRAAIPRLSLGLVLAAAALWLALNRERLDPTVLESAICDLGMLAPVAHVIFFALGTVLFVPGALFGLAGGALFGPAWGTLLNLAGATIGATAAFLVARYIAADWVTARAGVRLERLVAGVEAEGWRFVALVRLVPLFPFSLMNYALGLTRISLTHYVAASLVCMLPGTVAYTWLGHAGRQALGGNNAAIQYGLLALALLAAIAFLPRLVQSWRGQRPLSWIEVDELAAALARDGRMAIVDVRGPDEFVGPLGHISVATNLPVDELPHRIGELDAFIDKPVVLVCRTDKRSAAAATLLRGAGFSRAQVLRGGMERWNRAGLPVEGL